jgi:DNA-3-methyladenine glycosylase
VAAERKPLRILDRAFYSRDTEVVARDLLGAVLVCRTDEGTASGMIVETEAYIGEEDPACHAAAGRTGRTEPLYGRPGLSYVYFIYGVHWCFNAVTRAKGLPSAVLVRALQPLDGIELMRSRRGPRINDVNLTNGPGKLCAALGIDRRMNGLSLQSGPLVIRGGDPLASSSIVTTTRIGITKAADWPLRYYIKGNSFVSKA